MKPFFSASDRDSHANPAPATAILIRGHTARAAGDLIAARQFYRAAICEEAQLAEAHAALGDVLVEMGAATEAATAFAHAAGLEPDTPRHRLAWAEALITAGMAVEAIPLLRQVLAQRPDSAAAHRGLLHALSQSGTLDAAIFHGREALALDGGDPDTAHALAKLLHRTGATVAAAELLQPLLYRFPDHTPLRFTLAELWWELGESAKARHLLHPLLELELTEENEAATRLTVDEECDAPAPTHAPPPARTSSARALWDRIEAEDRATLPPAYVRSLFNQYADRFDHELTTTLNYQAPALLRDAIVALDQSSGVQSAGTFPAAASRDIYDLGCGTGLAGILFRPLARWLGGVDLSPGMLAKARTRALYDVLEEDDLCAGLARYPHALDLIIAADVLVYLGDLAPVFQAVATALRPNGRFAATVEQSLEADYICGAHRRFAHSAPYLTRTLAAAGLHLYQIHEVVLRTEKRQPVTGLLFVAGKQLFA